MPRTIHCLGCRMRFLNTEIKNPELLRTSNGRARFVGKCPNGHRVSKFISKKDLVSGEGIVAKLLKDVVKT